jgi:hypothetical protein
MQFIGVMARDSLVKKLMFSALKMFHFMPCFAVFFSTENINAENVSLYAVFHRIFQR